MILLESRYHWIDSLFDWCVQTMKDFGSAFGMNYYKSKTLKWVTWISVIITLVSPLIFELIIRL